MSDFGITDLNLGAFLLAASGTGLAWWIYWPADSGSGGTLEVIAAASVFGAALFVAGIVSSIERRCNRTGGD